MNKNILLFPNWIYLSDTIGEPGPDGGKTLIVEELPKICRIDVEKKQKNKVLYYSVTIVVYNKLLHTSYFHDWDDVVEHVATIKLLVQNTIA